MDELEDHHILLVQRDSGEDHDRGSRVGTGGVETGENNLRERVLYQWRVGGAGVIAAAA